MKTRELTILVTLAEELHFGRAADRLGIAQPQLSEHIRRIESDAGLTLFLRRPRVRLTAGGEIVVETARKVLAELHEGTRRARAVAAGIAGRVAVGFAPVAMATDLPQVLRAFRDENPGVELALTEGPSGHLREQLARGDIDLMVARASHSAEEFASLRFAWDEVNAMLPQDHHTAAHAQIEPAMLSEDEFVLFPRSANPPYHDRLMQWGQDAGLRINARWQTESLIASMALVGAGLGVSFGTTFLSRIAMPGTVFRPFAGEKLDVSFWASWAPERLNPAGEKLLDLIRRTREAA